MGSAQFALSGLTLLQQRHICSRELNMHAEPLCQPLKAGLTEEADVCGVEYIMPTRKCLLAVDTFGHQPQPAALRQQCHQAGKLAPRGGKVLEIGRASCRERVE